MDWGNEASGVVPLDTMSAARDELLESLQDFVFKNFFQTYQQHGIISCLQIK